jgi:hypothetical protein
MGTRVLISSFLLLPLSAASVNTSPQYTLPLPEVSTLVQQAILQQQFAESKERDYVFREDFGANKLRKQCTWAPHCPGIPTPTHPAGIAYQVLENTERKFEIFWLDGIRVARMVPNCDYCGTGLYHNTIRDIPISAEEFAAENKQVDREIAEARALRAQGKDASSKDHPPQILFSRMLELCSFSKPRRDSVESRSTILLEFVCNPPAKTLSTNEALLEGLSGTVGIDEEDHAVQHVEGRFLTDVKVDGGAIKIRKGTWLVIANTRVDPGIWLLSKLFAKGEARYFAFSMDGDAHVFAGNYRKFHVTTTILPGYTALPTQTPASNAPEPAQSPVEPH